MNKKYVTFAAVSALAIASIMGLQSSYAQQDGHSKFMVTVTNLTPGQPLTPPLIVAHEKGSVIFETGVKASDELSQLAQNGNAQLLADKLGPQVYDVVMGDAPLVPANDPGNTGLSHMQEFTVEIPKRIGYLSFASMLVCTNDGFAGIDTVRLPLVEKTIYAMAYDARSEANTEDFADLVPPCQDAIGMSSDDAGSGESNPEIAEDGIVIPHPGIYGDEDLTQRTHGWNGPVAKITVERIN